MSQSRIYKVIMSQSRIYLLWVKVEYTYYESKYNILLWVKVEYTYYESK